MIDLLLAHQLQCKITLPSREYDQRAADVDG